MAILCAQIKPWKFYPKKSCICRWTALGANAAFGLSATLMAISLLALPKLLPANTQKPVMMRGWRASNIFRTEFTDFLSIFPNLPNFLFCAIDAWYTVLWLVLHSCLTSNTLNALLTSCRVLTTSWWRTPAIWAREDEPCFASVICMIGWSLLQFAICSWNCYTFPSYTLAYEYRIHFEYTHCSCVGLVCIQLHKVPGSLPNCVCGGTFGMPVWSLLELYLARSWLRKQASGY